MPGHRPPAAKWDGVHVRVNYHGEDTIKGNLEDGKNDEGGGSHLASLKMVAGKMMMVVDGSHLAGEEEISAGNGDGVFRSLEEVSWL